MQAMTSQFKYANHFDALVALVAAMPIKTDMHATVLDTAEKAASHDTPDDQNLKDGLIKLLIRPKEDYWNDDLSVWFVALRKRDETPIFILKQIVVELSQAINLPEGHPMLMPLLMAAILGGVPMLQEFHSHHHTREVVCIASILALLHNTQKPFTDSKTRLAEIIIAACIHDFAHDGQGNRANNNHTPMRLENRALAKAEPYMEAVDIPDASWQRIKAMVLATDVSKGDADDTSPAEWMRKAFLGEALATDCPVVLQPFFTDRELATQAALLEDADLGTSAGMPYEFARRMTALIAQETKVLSPTPQTLIGFIDHICKGAYITDAARTLFDDNLKDLRSAADAENEDTIYYWS